MHQGRAVGAGVFPRSSQPWPSQSVATSLSCSCSYLNHGRKQLRGVRTGTGLQVSPELGGDRREQGGLRGIRAGTDETKAEIYGCEIRQRSHRNR